MTPSYPEPEMDPRTREIKIRSHNINGFDSSREFLFNECDNNSFSIAAIQEHWLRPSYRKQLGTNRLKVLHPNYDAYAVSAMTSQLGKSISKGRPYGGTGFLFDKNLSDNIRARVDLKHERVSVMELVTDKGKILLLSCYMPYYCTAKLADQLTAYRETVGFIEGIMSSHPMHSFILLMDMNCSLFHDSHPYSSIIKAMMRDFGLLSSFDFIPGFCPDSDFTRFDLKRGSYTLIDGILISKSLYSSVESSSILHPPLNVSDHLPVEIILRVEMGESQRGKSVVSNYIPWSTLSEEELSAFRNCMSSNLREIVVPYHSLDHGSSICSNCDCALALEKFYCDILSAVEVADRCLPRKKHGLAKPYWSPELNVLKQKSIDAHKVWRDCNCPKSGPVFREKVNANYQYKLLLRRSKNSSS